MKKPYALLILLVLGAFLYWIGNENLLNYTRYDPSSSLHMTGLEFEEKKTQSFPARFWFITMFLGWTLGTIAMLEFATLKRKSDL